jgi:GNAT superfamily N-acetyltransferase
MTGAPTVCIRSLRRKDARAVKRLWSERFGGDPDTQQNWIDAVLDTTHAAAGCVAVQESEGVGTSFMDVGSRAYTRQYLGLDVIDLDFPLTDENGIFHLSCVREDKEGRGIGSAFYERRLAEMFDRGVRQAFGIAWHRPHTVDSRVLFEKYDFERLTTAETYYTRTGDRPHCPDCTGPCRCTASLFVRPMEPNGPSRSSEDLDA